jgi:ring-1,2-phenylacetyl-CoA epoxidase subunit PaaD
VNHPALKHGSNTPDIAAVQRALETVVDPEIPVLTIRDLGVLRDVRVQDGQVVVTITPTYSGCPAMVEIRESIEKTLVKAGVENARIETRLAPAWTTDWMSEEGRKKLLDYGIAPPSRRGAAPTGSPNAGNRGEGAAPTSASDRGVGAAPSPRSVACPQCGSEDTRLISEFGSTACKAMYQCNTCLEPFDHFKCH